LLGDDEFEEVFELDTGKGLRACAENLFVRK